MHVGQKLHPIVKRMQDYIKERSGEDMYRAVVHGDEYMITDKIEKLKNEIVTLRAEAKDLTSMSDQLTYNIQSAAISEELEKFNKEQNSRIKDIAATGQQRELCYAIYSDEANSANPLLRNAADWCGSTINSFFEQLLGSYVPIPKVEVQTARRYRNERIATIEKRIKAIEKEVDSIQTSFTNFKDQYERAGEYLNSITAFEIEFCTRDLHNEVEDLNRFYYVLANRDEDPSDVIVRLSNAAFELCERNIDDTDICQEAADAISTAGLENCLPYNELFRRYALGDDKYAINLKTVYKVWK